jgi:hypothetical protein
LDGSQIPKVLGEMVNMSSMKLMQCRRLWSSK